MLKLLQIGYLTALDSSTYVIMTDIAHQFYSAFQRLDAEPMVALYHPEVYFEDPGFGPLHGADAAWMWRMLCANAQDFELRFEVLEQTDTHAKTHWEADYTFSRTGRRVHNRITAEMTIEDGLITRHIDTFNLRTWAGQALGWQGKLLGGTNFFKRKLHQQTNHMLQRYRSKNDPTFSNSNA